eukprot:CAMPEP_0204573030 /NCGR_PEP_ID=MMETSP0661-20131031/39786_1 /ASSEMBLY_ACC=CAM_ASM_000606 /TAXON_ID=109239 /ORGANISM="Alexandrium margalefi, Strain AMGDE01CS-322" /LENGTH=504 /DNA_ID=CAMNT_0051581417 /DNA_START=32 /DNA_END=1546 /DNA_ORIENTATION=+
MGRRCARGLWGLPFLPVLLQAAAAADEQGTCAAGGGPCGAESAYFWPSQKGTPGRTGFSPHAVPDISKPPAWSWADTHDDVIRATPLFDDKLNIYLTTIAGRVYKFNEHGRVIWQKTLPHTIPQVACIHQRKLFFATKFGQVRALDMETGEERWTVTISTANITASDTASVFCYNGTIVSATHDNLLSRDGGNSDVVALTAEDGSFLWRFKPDIFTYNFQASTPQDGTIVFQDKSGGAYRLTLDDGRVIWRSGRRGLPWINTETTGAAVCHDGKVYVVSNMQPGSPLNPANGLLHVYAVDDGRFLWEQVLEYAANQAVAIGPSPTDKGRHVAVVGMGANPGLPLAMSAYPIYGKWGALFLHFMSLYFPWLFANNQAAMAAYDAETGKKLWHYELSAYRKPATAGDTERVLKRYDDLTQGINPHNDPLCLPDSCSQPVIAADGTAFQGWQDGRVYAVKDANGDGQIDKNEVSWYQLSDGFQGSLGLGPGILAAAPCGGGMYVWRL